MSSSAFVLQLLKERGEMATRFGSATLGILLLQVQVQGCCICYGALYALGPPIMSAHNGISAESVAYIFNL